MALKQTDGETPDFTEVSNFLREHGKVDEKGDIACTAGTYYAWMDQQGLSRAVLDQVATAHERMVGGMIDLAGDQLEPRIIAAKEAGDDPSRLRSIVKVLSPGGQFRATVGAQREDRSPRTGEKIITYGAVSVKIETDRIIPGSAVDRAHDRIGKLMT